jgi:hypothetical protein
MSEKKRPKGKGYRAANRPTHAPPRLGGPSMSVPISPPRMSMSMSIGGGVAGHQVQQLVLTPHMTPVVEQDQLDIPPRKRRSKT